MSLSRRWRAGLMLLAWLALANPLLADDVRPPNVILIVADDLGYGDLSCYGAQDIATPNLDQLASEGMRFTDYSVTAPLCTPSRVSLMTGCYPGRFGLARGVLRPDAMNGVPGSAVTLAEIVKTRGYATGAIGKWHLGFVSGMRPRDQGFDSYFGVLHNLDKVETDFFEAEGGMPVLRGDTVIERPAIPAEMTGLYTQESLAYIEQHANHPFFLYLAHQMPHLPFDASEKFKGTSKRGLYGDVVQELDWSVRQIVEKLKELHLEEQTLILFTSDNGPERKTEGSAKPLQGSKHTVFEGGVRVPLIAWGPSRVPPGRVCEEFVSCLDIWPTLADLAGADYADVQPLDGISFRDVLLGQRDAVSRRESLFVLYGFRERQLESYRKGRWKLHLSTPPKLYDLSADIAESNDVAAAYPKIVNGLAKEAAAARSTLVP